MFCKNCGSALPEGTKFCPKCGAAVENKVEEAKVETATTEEPKVESIIAEEAKVEPIIAEEPKVEETAPVVESNPAPVAQPTVTPAAPAQNNVKPANGNKTLLIVLISVFGVLILGLIIFILITVLGGNKGSNTNTPVEPTTEVVTPKEPTTTPDPTPTPTTSGKTITVNGVTFTISDSYITDTVNGATIIYDSEKKSAVGFIQVFNGSLNSIVSTKALETTLEGQGYTAISSSSETEDGIEAYMVKFYYNGVTHYYSAISLDSDSTLIAEFMINPSAYMSASDVLKKYTSIIKTAEGNSIESYSGNGGLKFAPEVKFE